MKYVLLGSTGHITKPVAVQLIEKGHEVTIVSSNQDKVKEIESLGAKAAVGSVQDGDFLKKAFAGADAVYLMIPPVWEVSDWLEYQKKVGHNYLEAVKSNNIKHVVVLSSIGAHMRKGAGPVDGLGALEESFNELKDVNTRYLRPSYFYYNLFSMIPMIKHAGIMGSAQSADHTMVLVHTSDIADAAAEELLKLDFKGQSVRYVASEEKTWKEITAAIADAINKPGLPFVEFTDEQSRQGMLGAGLHPVIAEGYVEMGKALRTGEMQGDYMKNKPTKFGKVKLADFVKEFAAAYNA